MRIDGKTQSALRETVKAVKGMSKTSPVGREMQGAPIATGRIAKTTSTITAISSTTPGSGTANLCLFSGTSLSDTSTAIKVYNIMDKTILSGKYVQVQLIGGYWFVSVCACGSLGS